MFSKKADLRGRNFLKLLDYTPEEIEYLLDLSADFKNKKHKGIAHEYLKGKNIVLLFEKTSTRTRCSFEVAGLDLGMGVTYLDPNSSQMGKKESIADTARVSGRMYDGIEYRGYAQTIVENLASYAGVPVWNGLQYGVDPYVAVAISLLETGCKWNCTVSHNNVGGNMVCYNGKCYIRSFNTIEEGITYHISNLYNGFYAKGITEVTQIGRSYAASPTWSQRVYGYIEEIRNK